MQFNLFCKMTYRLLFLFFISHSTRFQSKYHTCISEKIEHLKYRKYKEFKGNCRHSFLIKEKESKNVILFWLNRFRNLKQIKNCIVNLVFLGL